MQILVASGTGPTEECTMHVFKDYCTEGQCLATEYCPAESVVQKGFLDYTREDYGPSIVAQDNDALVSTQEKKLEEQGGCTVHNAGTVVIDPGTGEEGGENGSLTPDLDPVIPTTSRPSRPRRMRRRTRILLVLRRAPLPGPRLVPPRHPPDTGTSDDWWNDLWQNNAG